MNLKNGKVFTSKSVGTGPSSYEKRIYRAAISHSLRNTALDHMGQCMYVYMYVCMYVCMHVYYVYFGARGGAVD